MADLQLESSTVVSECVFSLVCFVAVEAASARGAALSQREMENEGPDVVNNLREDDESSSDEVRTSVP